MEVLVSSDPNSIQFVVNSKVFFIQSSIGNSSSWITINNNISIPSIIFDFIIALFSLLFLNWCSIL